MRFGPGARARKRRRRRRRRRPRTSTRPPERSRKPNASVDARRVLPTSRARRAYALVGRLMQPSSGAATRKRPRTAAWRSRSRRRSPRARGAGGGGGSMARNPGTSAPPCSPSQSDSSTSTWCTWGGRTVPIDRAASRPGLGGRSRTSRRGPGCAHEEWPAAGVARRRGTRAHTRSGGYLFRGGVPASLRKPGGEGRRCPPEKTSTSGSPRPWSALTVSAHARSDLAAAGGRGRQTAAVPRAWGRDRGPGRSGPSWSAELGPRRIRRVGLEDRGERPRGELGGFVMHTSGGHRPREICDSRLYDRGGLLERGEAPDDSEVTAPAVVRGAALRPPRHARDSAAARARATSDTCGSSR